MTDSDEEGDQPESIVEEESLCQTRLGRTSKPVDLSRRFLESSNYTEDDRPVDNGVWIKPYYYDDVDMVERLSDGNFYSESYFSSRFTEEEVK